MSDETNEVSVTVMTKGGELYTAEALARKLKGAIVEVGGTPMNDDDEAIAALAGFEEGEGWAGSLSNEQMEDFVDEFCEAWSKD